MLPGPDWKSGRFPIVPLESLSGLLLSLMESPQESEPGEKEDDQPCEGQGEAAGIGSTERWSWKDPEGDLMPSFYRWGN